MPKKVISKNSKRRLIIFGTASVVAITYFFITLLGYLYSYISLKNEEINLKAEIVSLQDEKANLKIEIQKLNDPEYVARYAKEKFLYSSDGEYVIKIDTNEIEKTANEKEDNTIYVVAISCIIFTLIVLTLKKKTGSKK